MYFSACTEGIRTFRHALRAAYRTAISAAQILVLIIMRRSSVGGCRILRRTLSVCLSVRPVPGSTFIIIGQRHPCGCVVCFVIVCITTVLRATHPTSASFVSRSARPAADDVERADNVRTACVALSRTERRGATEHLPRHRHRPADVLGGFKF